jgi:hypothetical protein
MTAKAIVKKLQKRLTAIGKERDRLRDLEDEVLTLKESCEEGYDNLERAIDALSQLV